MAVPFLAYTETFALLVRKRNSGAITARSFRASITRLQSETMLSRDVQLLSLRDDDFLAATGLIDRHAINSSDAALLAAFLRFRAEVSGVVCVVACDRHLLRAAQREGFLTLNPEQVRPDQVTQLLAP